MDLYRQYRPDTFKHMIGNARTIESLTNMLKKEPKKRPHCLMFVGPPGCGKTTFGYIFAKELGCVHSIDEYNSGSFRGIDTVREMQRKLMMKAQGGDSARVIIIEEGHKLTPDAQEALLKPTEQCPNHVYFILTTTNPTKITAALRTRFVQFAVDALSEEQLVAIMKRATDGEKKVMSEKALAKIASLAIGSARRAFSMLEAIIDIPKEKQLAHVSCTQDVEEDAKKLCQLLLKKGTQWSEVAAFLKSTKDDPETLRWAVLGYMNAVLLNGGVARAYVVMTAFLTNYYDSGKAGLSASAYEAMNG